MVNYFVGKNAHNNWELLSIAHQNHTLFHLEKFSSPYVIVDQSIDKLYEEEIEQACFLCWTNSKMKKVSTVKIFYTPVSNVYKGSDIGSIIIKSNKKKKIITFRRN